MCWVKGEEWSTAGSRSAYCFIELTANNSNLWLLADFSYSVPFEKPSASSLLTFSLREYIKPSSFVLSFCCRCAAEAAGRDNRLSPQHWIYSFDGLWGSHRSANTCFYSNCGIHRYVYQCILCSWRPLHALWNKGEYKMRTSRCWNINQLITLTKAKIDIRYFWCLIYTICTACLFYLEPVDKQADEGK